MNPWDVVTWAAAFALAGSGTVIFGFFLRDVRGILEREPDDESEPSSDPKSETKKSERGDDSI